MLTVRLVEGAVLAVGRLTVVAAGKVRPLKTALTVWEPPVTLEMMYLPAESVIVLGVVLLSR